MAVYKGGQKIEDLYCGSAKIGKIYKGSTLVYSSVKYYTFTINPTPSNATVKINNQTTKSVTVAEGTSISWSVSASGYKTQSGTLILTANTTKNITLAKAEPLYYCYKGTDPYYGMGTLYYYAKTPVGSDLSVYYNGVTNSANNTVSSSSQLRKMDNGIVWQKISSTSGTAYGIAFSRYTAGDLYS